MSDLIGLRLLGALCAGVFVASLLRLFVKPTTKLSGRVRPYTAAARSLLGKTPDRAALNAKDVVTIGGVIPRLYRPLVESLTDTITRLFGATFDDQAVLLKLRQARIMGEVPEAVRVQEYRVRQVGSGLGWGLGFGLVGAILVKSPAAAIALFLLGTFIGVSRKTAFVGKEIEGRRERMRIELYTINQLLAIYLRTSGSPVLAAQRLVRRGRGAVIDELSEALRLHARGMSANRAFMRLAEQTPEPFAARTYKLLASGAERGADIAAALLSLSEDVRDNRRTEIRRRATKRQGAMLIPIIFFLAPVMLLFIAGPIPSLLNGTL